MMEIEDMMRLSTHRKSLFTNKNGFTLIELAMVMIIVGLLLTIGMSLVGPLTKKAKLIEAREAVKAAKEAVLGFTVRNNGLLPPLLPNPPGPLGASGAATIDAWGKNLFYISETETTQGTGVDVCGLTTPVTPITVRMCPNVACAAPTSTVSNVALVIISGADNFNIQTNISGANNVDIYPVDTPNIDNYTVAPDPNRLENYDDVVVYVSLDEIRTARGCAQPLVITSPTTLPQGEEDSFYSYSLQAIGGRPPYTWSIATQPGSGLTMNASGLISGTINVNNVVPNTGELTACNGTINVTNATLSDSGGSPPVTFTGIIPVRPKPLAISNTEMPTAKVGTPYTVTLNGSAGNSTTYTWTLTAGTLPTGLNLVLGQITGTPSAAGAPSFTIQLADPCLTTISKSFTITVNP
ncbi:MAG: putative Ig domain-containing protein [Deltaproteobacteria bacterium]